MDAQTHNSDIPSVPMYRRPRPRVASRTVEKIMTEAELKDVTVAAAEAKAVALGPIASVDEVLRELTTCMRSNDLELKLNAAAKLLGALGGAGDGDEESKTFASLARRAAPPPIEGDGEHDKLAQSVPSVPNGDETTKADK